MGSRVKRSKHLEECRSLEEEEIRWQGAGDDEAVRFRDEGYCYDQIPFVATCSFPAESDISFRIAQAIPFLYSLLVSKTNRKPTQEKD